MEPALDGVPIIRNRCSKYFVFGVFKDTFQAKYSEYSEYSGFKYTPYVPVFKMRHQEILENNDLTGIFDDPRLSRMI